MRTQESGISPLSQLVKMIDAYLVADYEGNVECLDKLEPATQRLIEASVNAANDLERCVNAHADLQKRIQELEQENEELLARVDGQDLPRQ